MKSNNKIIEIFQQSRRPDYNYLLDYYKYDVADFEAALKTVSAEVWVDLGKKKFLDLFHLAAVEVPAYRNFLAEYKIDHNLVKTWEDFQKVPTVDKDNYIKKYPLEELCWQDTFNRQHMISASSGSSGDPFLWFRSSWQEYEASLTHELMFRKFWQIDKRPTLLVVNFAMGMYVAGVLTQNCGLRLAQKNYPLTVVSPGISIGECVKIIKKLGHKYEQVILAGYPPFIKDIIDAADQAGIAWQDINMRFLLAGEGFSEDWRNFLLNKVSAQDKVFDSFSIYGTADANILAHETPVSITIRRLASKQPDLAKLIFPGNEHLPGFFQFNPLSRYFESGQKEIIFSADSSIPLLRYNIHDTGQVIDYNDIKIALQDKELPDGFDSLMSEWPWPFLALQGKKSVVIYYGLLIYPDNIRAGLEQSEVNSLVSGRAVTAKKYDTDLNSYLEINVELADKVKPNPELEKAIVKALIQGLIKTNLEYGRLHEAMGIKVNPKVNLFTYGDSQYFSRQGKQSWIITGR